MLKTLKSQFTPNMVVLFRPCDEEYPEITRMAEFTKNLLCIDGKATAYICHNYNCKLPTTDVVEMLKLLKQD
jgi:uncharacterized protein YyaL (SSP411 family)